MRVYLRDLLTISVPLWQHRDQSFNDSFPVESRNLLALGSRGQLQLWPWSTFMVDRSSDCRSIRVYKPSAQMVFSCLVPTLLAIRYLRDRSLFRRLPAPAGCASSCIH